MKNTLLKSTMVLLFGMLLIASGCKYEDGPIVSFRAKSDRLAQIWNIDKVTFEGNDFTSSYKKDGVIIAFEVYKNNAYTFNYRNEDKTIINQSTTYALSKSFPMADLPFIQTVGSSGRWTFVNNFEGIQMDGELSQDPNNKVVPEVTILELKKSALKLKGVNASGQEFVVECSPMF